MLPQRPGRNAGDSFVLLRAAACRGAEQTRCDFRYCESIGTERGCTPTAAPKAPDVSKEALVFDQLQTRIRMEADGTGTRETIARIRILADAGVKAMAVLTFTYTAQNQQVDIGYVRVKKPDGSVVVTPDYNVQDMPADVTREAPMYSDIHQKHVAVKGLGVGDTLEYQMTLRTLKPRCRVNSGLSTRLRRI